uniref:NADH-ubiquinone oxidoreductase chain 6 n=1 Tax=Prionobrama filigera TaxID=1180191 RepID=A0A7S6VG75_9TELE|nr:NADH dehydrogenase subunit 6 [Prionobrama filigera]
MLFLYLLLLTAFVLGLVAVVASPSAHFSALALVFCSSAACGIIVWHGGSIISLMLLLMYTGGMLVVFAFTSALAADPHPEGLGIYGMSCYALCYFALAGSCLSFYFSSVLDGSIQINENTGHVVDSTGTGILSFYIMGGGLLIIAGWVLLMSLVVILQLARKVSKDSKRPKND